MTYVENFVMPQAKASLKETLFLFPSITDTDHHSHWHELLSFVSRLSYFQGSSVFPSMLSLVEQRYQKINISYHLYYLWIKSARVTGNFLKALSLRGFCSLCFNLGATNYIFYFWPIKDRTVPAKFPKCFNGALWFSWRALPCC